MSLSTYALLRSGAISLWIWQPSIISLLLEVGLTSCQKFLQTRSIAYFIQQVAAIEDCNAYRIGGGQWTGGPIAELSELHLPVRSNYAMGNLSLVTFLFDAEDYKSFC